MNKKRKLQKSQNIIENNTIVSRLALWLYQRVVLSASFWIALFIFGLLSYTVFMQRQGFPTVNVPISTVSGLYLVGDKTVVDERLSQPLVEIIGKTEGVKATTATTTNDQVTVVVEYEESVSAKAGNDSVQKQIDNNRAKLPEQARLSFQAIDATRYNNKYDILLSLSAKDATAEQLNAQADAVVGKLKQQIPQATKVEVEPLIEQGINPRTGQAAVQQTSFDWFGVRDGDNLAVNPSVVIGITPADNEDIVSFDKQVGQATNDLNNSPELAKFKLSIAASFAPSITQQVNSLQKNLLEGLIIVVLVSLIFIGVRAGTLAAIGMLVTLTSTIGVLYAVGITLNTISLFGLVLCLGLIVDDIVIMIEALDRQRKANKPLPEAIKNASGKVAVASAAGTFTTVLGFAPLLFIGGILGEFIRILPITIIISLLVSLVVSLLFVPYMSRWFFAKKPKPAVTWPFGWIRHAVDKLGDAITHVIMGANTTGRKAAYVIGGVGISLLFILGTGPLFSKLQFDIFPTAKDSDDLVVEYTFLPGTSLADAVATTQKANDIILSNSGESIERISYLGQANNFRSTAQLGLVPYSKRDQTAKQIGDRLQTELASLKGTRIKVNQQSAGPPKEDFPFKVQIDSTDPAKADQVAMALASFLQGRAVERTNGTTAKISEVSYTGERATITRLDGKRVVQVQAAFDDVDTSALVQAAQRKVEDDFIANADNLKGLDKSAIAFDFGSETENQESFKSVLIALPLLVLAMYLLLAAQFRSIFQPLLILVAVPFSLFGVATALLLTDNPLSFFVMIAFFALIGISVNNTILLTDFANQARRRGLSPRAAMAEAIHERTRPLLTTSLTSILALLPLALSDPFWESLAVTLIGGLTASAILVLVSFPCYYLSLEAARSRVAARRARAKN